MSTRQILLHTNCIILTLSQIFQISVLKGIFGASNLAKKRLKLVSFDKTPIVSPPRLAFQLQMHQVRYKSMCYFYVKGLQTSFWSKVILAKPRGTYVFP